MVFGTFDLLHEGHLFVLSEAMKRGDVTVIVARDDHVKEFKGKSPVGSQEERMDVLKKRFPMATVELGDEKDFLMPVIRTKPDLIVLGYDQRLPPGVSFGHFPCFIERLPSFSPEKYKSSLIRRS